MRRTFKMTPIAQQALWRPTSNKPYIPTQFEVNGTAKTGYSISHINNDGHGLHIISLRSFYAVKKLVEEINNTGTTDFKPHCATDLFAYANTPIPE